MKTLVLLALLLLQDPFPNPFSQPPVPLATLTVSKSGNGSGTVTGTGISCGSDCSQVFNRGVSVTLSATASGADTFAGWAGACTGTGTCVVTMAGAQAVTAAFTSTSGVGAVPYFNCPSEPAFNSGADTTVKFCDDFTTGWYVTDHRVAGTPACASPGNPNPAPTTDRGWCGNPGGGELNLPTQVSGFGPSGFAARMPFINQQGGQNIATHALNGFTGLTAFYVRLYYYAAPGKAFGAQKFITFNSVPDQLDTPGLHLGNIQFNCGAGGQGSSGNPQYQILGGPSCFNPNITPGFEVTSGRLYYFEWHFILNTFASSCVLSVNGTAVNPSGCIADGTWEQWINDCGSNPLVPACGATPTLRSRYTNMPFTRYDSSHLTYTTFYIDQWANPPSNGTDYISNIVVRTTPIGFK